MISLFLSLGVLVATFVGFNIGGSSTGVAWGPAVGANLVNKTAAAGLMTVFVFVGGWTLGRNVIDTLGGDLVPRFSPTAIIVVLGFIGLGMLVANVYGVPVSTSMTAVGAISGYGFATNTLDRAALGGIVVWWLVAPIVGFWCGSLIGRYIYPYLDSRVSIPQSDGPLVTYRWLAVVPVPQLGPGTTTRELYSTALVLLIACYMSFSAGASNVANAVAPLVGGGSLDVNVAIALGTVAIGIGAFTIARRTMESVGNDITDLPMLAAIVVMVVASTITTFLSWIGIPMSLAMATIMTIIGLGWGRATRTATVPELVTGKAQTQISVDSLAAETSDGPQSIGEEEPEKIETATQLFDPGTVVRFVSFWIIGPSMATLLSFAFFTVF
ncbi:inorganic phosphate transporter [Halorhabdus amylolytica]|uniref:inorganic phosphate transporter n=1 Tax=Halorhabdus amylolytica TaxID=2559573 RepID=UPI0010AB06C8|nr:inorganic phosphate transporter [Halorhabdus amylolytica]